jgi:hypothetical protein
MKNVFMLKDNIVDKKLIEIIKIQTFDTRIIRKNINSRNSKNNYKNIENLEIPLEN